MRHPCLIDTCETERRKVLSTCSMFRDQDLPMRPHPTDPRRLSSIMPSIRYAAWKRCGAKTTLGGKRRTAFFDLSRTLAWIVVRRIAHTAHHRGRQTALLRMLGRALYGTYGPTADTGWLRRTVPGRLTRLRMSARFPARDRSPLTDRPEQ
jgi:hypothetical protein